MGKRKPVPEIFVFSKQSAQRILSGPLYRGVYKSLVSMGWSLHQGDEPPPAFDLFEGAKTRIETMDVSYQKSNRGHGLELPKHPGAPTIHTAKQVLDFADSGISGPVLCHCYAGWSRSQAAALLMRALWLGAGKEDEAVRLSSGAPNVVIVLFGDRLLGRRGALWRAYLRGRGAEGDPTLSQLAEEAFSQPF